MDDHDRHGDHTSTTYDRLGRTQRARPTSAASCIPTRLRHRRAALGQTTANLTISGRPASTIPCSIGTTYDDLGRVQSVTSYCGHRRERRRQPGRGHLRWLGQPKQEYQAHDGVVDTGPRPVYNTTTTTATAPLRAPADRRLTTGSRRSMYPNGDATFNYNYAAGVDAIMSRLSTSATTGTLASLQISRPGPDRRGRRRAATEAHLSRPIRQRDRPRPLRPRLRISFGSGRRPRAACSTSTPTTYDRAGNVSNESNIDRRTARARVYCYDAARSLDQWSLDGISAADLVARLPGQRPFGRQYNAANEETPTLGSSVYDLPAT